MTTQTRFKDNMTDSITAAGKSLENFDLDIGGGIFKALKKYLLQALKESGLTLNDGKSKRNPDGSITHKMTFIYQPTKEDPKKEFTFYVNGKPSGDNNELVDLSFKYPDLESDPSGKKMKEEIDKYTDVPNKSEEIMKRCQWVLDKALGVDTIESFPENLEASSSIDTNAIDIDNCKILNFTVKKVSATAGYKLKFSNICANYSPLSVRADLDAISGDTEFVDSLTMNTPSQFGVVVTDDDFNVESLDDAVEAEIEAEKAGYIDIACNSILDQAYKLLFDAKFFSYLACGSDKDKIVGLADNYTWRIESLIDTISKRMVEHKIFLDNPFSQIRRSSVPTIYNNQYPRWEDFETVMCQDIQELISVMTLFSSNFEKAEEAEVLEWIRSWTSELNYNLYRSSELCKP